jgi:glycosyltransferase involved in cell wall biosynthesis
VLTPIYPSSDLICQTTVVHTFAKDWKALGHEVRVVHNIVSFPRIIYFLASYFREFIQNKFGTKINFSKVKSDIRYVFEGIEVFRFPMFKNLPHDRYSNNQILSQIKKIKEVNDKDGFSPDIIIGHWTNPQIEILPILKTIYNSKACLIFHDKGFDFKHKYKKDGKLLLSKLDVIGYRSMVIKNHIELIIGVPSRSFICYSGISDLFFDNFKQKNIKNDVLNFVFVGDLFARKNPIILLKALDKTYQKLPFSIDYVGIGFEKSKIIKASKKLNQFSKIKFHGQLTQDRIKDLYFDADCFIMLSKNEAFGLVYLEAMAMGCLTVCSKNEGVDGIIVHGKNGFLCEEGNVIELAELINSIKNMPIEERKRISNNAILTSKEFSRFEVAKNYLNDVV